MKQHKSEKGVRKPGSLGPWHPARVIFRVPLSGQLGMFSRPHYNFKVLASSNMATDKIKLKPFRHYGNINSNYVVLHGSVQGPAKRQVLLTSPLRPSLKQTRRKLEMIEVHI